MAKSYRCTNIGNCTKADAKSVISLPDGAETICPECEKELTETKTPGGPSLGLILGVAGVLFLIVAGVAVKLLLGQSVPPPQPTPSPVPSVAPTVTPAATPAPSATPVATPATPVPTPVYSILFRIHGSNTIGSELAPELVKGFLISQGFRDVRRIELAHEECAIVGFPPNSSQLSGVEIKSHGSGTAFAEDAKNKQVGLSGRFCDIGMASRAIKPEEYNLLQASGLGDSKARGYENVIAMDGVAVIVHSTNPVDALSVDQIRKIFDGEITDWSQVGGKPGSMNIYARDNVSGTYDTFKNLVLGSSPLSPRATRFEDRKELSGRVSQDVNGIGFIGLPYINLCKAVKVYQGDSQQLLPTFFTVASENYLLARRLYFYVPPTTNSWVTSFLTYVMDERLGQNIVTQCKFVAFTEPEPSPVPQPDDKVTTAYRKLAEKAGKLQYTFFFNSGSFTLENKAKDDLPRVIRVLSAPKFRGKQVILVGYTDSDGPANKNVALSVDRAAAVAKEFSAAGLPVSAMGFGEDMPVRSNDTALGKEQNRRVEVWIER